MSDMPFQVQDNLTSENNLRIIIKDIEVNKNLKREIWDQRSLSLGNTYNFLMRGKKKEEEAADREVEKLE